MLNIWTDASIEPKNPGGHGVAGWVIKGLLDLPVTGVKDLGQYPSLSNNVCEYSAVVDALEWVVKTVKFDDFEKIVVHSDSQLIVNQCNDKWKCNNKELLDLRENVWYLCNQIPVPVEFKWIPREENAEADEVSRSLYK